MVTQHPYFRPTLGDPFGSLVGDTLQGPVIPGITGLEFLKLLAVGAAAVWLLKGMGHAFRGGASK